MAFFNLINVNNLDFMTPLEVEIKKININKTFVP